MFIGNKITELRKKRNYTQEQLAEKVGVTRQTLSNWESNITSPDLNQTGILCEELKININDLIDNNVEIEIKETNKVLSKLINKEVYIEFDDEFFDMDINNPHKVKLLDFNDEFIKIELLVKKKNVVKLIDFNLIKSIKLVEED